MKDNPCLVDKKPFIVYTDNLYGKVEPENLSESTQEIIDGKAEKAGYYPNLVSGDAFVDAVEDESAFTTRTSPVDYDGQAEIRSIKGVTYNDLTSETPVLISAKPEKIETSIDDETIGTLEIPYDEYFPQGMNGASGAYDELTQAKAIKRFIASDNAGSYTVKTSLTANVFYVETGAKKPGKTNFQMLGYASVTKNAEDLADMEATGAGANDRIYFRNNGCTTAAEAKTAITGAALVFEMSTAVETPIDPPLNLTFPVQVGCTETVTIGEGTENALATFDIFYPLSVKDYIEDMPQTFISAESMGNFIEALATEMQTTITQTYDEATKTYTYVFGAANSLHLQPIDTTLDNTDEPMPVNPDEDMR